MANSTNMNEEEGYSTLAPPTEFQRPNQSNGSTINWDFSGSGNNNSPGLNYGTPALNSSGNTTKTVNSTAGGLTPNQPTQAPTSIGGQNENTGGSFINWDQIYNANSGSQSARAKSLTDNVNAQGNAVTQGINDQQNAYNQQVRAGSGTSTYTGPTSLSQSQAYADLQPKVNDVTNSAAALGTGGHGMDDALLNAAAGSSFNDARNQWGGLDNYYNGVLGQSEATGQQAVDEATARKVKEDKDKAVAATKAVKSNTPGTSTSTGGDGSPRPTYNPSENTASTGIGDDLFHFNQEGNEGQNNSLMGGATTGATWGAKIAGPVGAGVGALLGATVFDAIHDMGIDMKGQNPTPEQQAAIDWGVEHGKTLTQKQYDEARGSNTASKGVKNKASY